MAGALNAVLEAQLEEAADDYRNPRTAAALSAAVADAATGSPPARASDAGGRGFDRAATLRLTRRGRPGAAAAPPPRQAVPVPTLPAPGSRSWVLATPTGKLAQLGARLEAASAAGRGAVAVVSTPAVATYTVALLSEFAEQGLYSVGRAVAATADAVATEWDAAEARVGRSAAPPLIVTDAESLRSAPAALSACRCASCSLFQLTLSSSCLVCESSTHECSKGTVTVVDAFDPPTLANALAALPSTAEAQVFLQPHEVLVARLLRHRGMSLATLPAAVHPLVYAYDRAAEAPPLPMVMRRKAFRAVPLQSLGCAAFAAHVRPLFFSCFVLFCP